VTCPDHGRGVRDRRLPQERDVAPEPGHRPNPPILDQQELAAETPPIEGALVGKPLGPDLLRQLSRAEGAIDGGERIVQMHEIDVLVGAGRSQR
jgi:hypothetical protein